MAKSAGGKNTGRSEIIGELKELRSLIAGMAGMKADVEIDTSDVEKANDELTKLNEKMFEAQKTLKRFKSTGQIHYFATQEKALAHLTRTWEEYKKASSEDDKKTASGKLMRWANAYRGAGYSTDSVEKEMFETADRIYESYKTTGKKGESNSQKLWARDVFEKVFGAAREVGVDITESDKYWERRSRNIRETVKKVTQESVEQVKSEPVELDVAELFKIDESGLKARMDKLKKSVKKIRDKLIDENGERTDKSLGKNQGAQFLKDLFELDKYNKDTGQLALKGSTKAFKIVLEEMGLKNDLKGDLKPFMSEAQENYNKALEKARRAVKKAGITPKPSSTKENLSEGESTENKSQLQKPMTQSAEDSKAAGKAADDAAKSFQKAAGAAEEAGDKAANSAARTRESAEETRSAAEETAEAAEAANNAQRQMSENRGDNGATQNAREAAAALNEEKEATRGLNDERERGVNSGSNDNTAERSRENAAALDEEKKAQQEVNEERSKGDKTSGQDEKPLSYLDAMILKLEEEKKKLKELQDESDKTRKMLDAASDVKELKKVREIIHGVVKNNQTGETKRNAFGFEGNPTALGSLVRQKISEGNMAKAAAYYGEYAKAGGTDKFFDLTGKDITAELAERYKQAAEAIGKNPDELRKALSEVNEKIFKQREVVSQIEKEVKTAQKEAAAQRKEQAQQEQVTNTDWQNGLNEQEIEAVEAYIKRMKALQKEAYNETSALAQAMSLLEKIKKRDMSGLMDQFTRADSPSSAMLGKMTNMPVNNQKARNDALRSLNQEEYDRLASQQTEGITKGIGKAVEKAKSETELKWEEFADAFLGTDVFADKTKGLDKHNVMKQFEKYGNTAKEALEEINKQWLSGTLDRSKFSGTSDKFVKEYIDALDAAKEKADAARSANVGDPDVNSLFSSGGTTALTQEQVDALHAEAKAYDELIAKKKEYYGIKEESYEPPEKLLNISYKAGNGRMQVDLSKLLPANQSDFKQLLDIVKLEDSQAAYEDNIKRVNDYINDMIKQAKRWLSKGEGRPWDPQNNPFDQVVAQNFGQMSSSKASGVLKKFQGYSGVLYQSMAKDLRVPKELSQVNADLFEQVKSGALDAIEAVELLRQKMQDFYNPPSTSSSSNASTFAADIKSLEGYSSANEDFVNQLIADVIAGQKEYDQAMNELKTHIAQRQEEIRAEEELRAKRVRNAGFGEDVKALENYGYADKDFIQKLTAQVLEGTKEYDDAMDELKAHIEQKHAEMMAAAEKSERDNAEIARYDELAKPMLEQMGFTDFRPEGFYRFVEAIREEGIDAEEALKRFADTFGYVYDQVNERWARPASRKDTFLMSTIEGYEDYIDKIAGKPELNAVKIAWDKALEEKDFQGVLDIVQKINEAFRQGKLDAEGYVEGVGYLDGMDWAKYYARYLTKDDKHGHGARYLDEVPEGWKKIEGALTAPEGYEWYSNGKSRFSGEYQQALVKIKEAADDVTESERQMGQAGEEAAGKVTKVTGDAYNDDLKSFARINSDILEEPKYEYDYDKLIERGGQLEQILTKVFDENPGTTLQTVIDTVQQELTDAQGRAKELDDTLKQIREGSKKWSFNDMLNDPDAFADDLNKLTEQLIALREAGKGDTKEALNLETRIQHMLAAQGKVFDQPNKKAFMPYFEKVQSKLTDGAKSIQDEMWEAMANGGNLTSRNDFPSLVADRLGLGIKYNKDFLADDIRELQSLLDILQHIDTVRGRISDQGKIDFFGKQVDRNLRIAKELEERLQGTSEEDRAYDPEWVENQYKYIAEHLQKAEELKKKIAELKGEVYEMQTFTAESVKAQLTQQQPEDPVENFKKTWTKAALKATEPPEALSQAYMQYIKDINSGAISAEDAMAGMEQVAKRLDVAFDEASQKWQKIQFSPEIQANLDAFNKALPSFEDGVSAKTFDDTKKKYEDLVYAIKYESKSAEEAIQEMLAAIKEAAAANGDLYGQEPSKSETPNRKFLVSATTPHAAKATYIKRTIAEDTDTSVEDLGEDISDVGGRAAEAVGNLDSFTKSAKNAAEAARKAAGIEGESRIISRSGVNGTSASATYELARGMHYTENWSYRNGNEETGEEPGWAMTSARYVINYQALLNDTITTMKQLAKAEADLALAQEQGRGENVTSQIQKQIGLYRTRIDQNAKLAEQYERMGDLEDELVLRDGYTKRQYDEDLKAQEELINAQSGAKKAKSVDDERKRQAAKQDKEVTRAQKYATERLVALKQLESSFTTEGSSRYLSAEDDRTAITGMAGKLRTKLEDIIKQNRAMTIDEMDDIITQFGDIKVEGDTRYSRSTAKKGDLSRQKVDSLKNVLSSDLDAFSQQAQRSSGDISHITEEVNKLKEALNGNVSSEFITESFQKLRELRAELKAINEEQRTKTSTEKARQAEIKLVAELQESYIKLAEAEEKRDHASTETGRELGRRQSDQIKKRQEELKKRVESTLGKDFANKAVAEAETEANKLRTAYANDRNEGISTKGLGFGENDDVERTWDTLIAKAQQYQKILYKQQSGGTITVNEAALLQKLSDLYQQAGEKAEEAGEKGQKFNEAVAAAQQAVRDSVISKYSETIGGLTAGNKNMPEAYNKQVEELKNNLEQLKNIDFDTTEWKEMVGNLDAGLNNLRTDASMRPVTDSQKAQLDRQMASWMNSNSGAGEFLGQVQRLRDALSNVRAEDEFNGIQSDFEKVRAAAADAGKTGESFGAGLKKRFKSLGQYLLSFASFYRVIGVFKQVYGTVKELDDALVEMRKVSDESLSSLQRYQSLSFNIADEVGTTARQIQQSTADWLRLGESFEEAQKSAKESTILLNVSEFDNIDKATEALVSASQAYKDLDKIDIIDKLNNIGNNFSISTDQLATGLQNSAAVLMTQGNDIDEALALLTAGKALPDGAEMRLKNIFKCVDYLKAHTTITAKARYDGLTT